MVALNVQLQAFMDKHIYPREHDWHEWCLDQDKLWTTPPWYDELRALKRVCGTFPAPYQPESRLTMSIAPLFETMSKVSWAQSFNCNAPDRGNMEVLAKYGTKHSRRSGSSRCSPVRFAVLTP